MRRKSRRNFLGISAGPQVRKVNIFGDVVTAVKLDRDPPNQNNVTSGIDEVINCAPKLTVTALRHATTPSAQS